MDKDLGRLHDAARGLLIDKRDELIQTGGSSSVIKKTRKTLSQLDWGVEQYADELDNLMTRGAGADEIRSYIRGIEEKALKDFQLLADDSVHHRVQSRTGGDTLSAAKSSDVRNVVKKLEQKYGMTFGNSAGPGGNLTADLSLSNYAHKADDRARGLEKESGIGKNPNKSTTAHARGTAGYAKPLTAKEIANEKNLFDALDRRVSAQIEDANQGLRTDAPRQQAIRDLTGDPLAYSPNGTAADVAKTKKSLLTIDPKKVMETYKNLTAAQQTKLIKQLSISSMIPVAGIALDGAETAVRSAKASKTKDPADILQAVISTAETGIGATGIGEALGVPLAAVNMMIDQHREGGSKFNGSGNGATRNGNGNGKVKIGINGGPKGRSGAKRKLAIA